MVKNLPVNAGDIIRDACSIPGSGTSPGERNAQEFEHSLALHAQGQGRQLRDELPHAEVRGRELDPLINVN